MQHSWQSNILVTLQVSGIIATCIPLAATDARNPVWLLVIAAGLALGFLTMAYNRPGNFSVFPEIRESATLITHGPYRWIRHPMYSALMLTMFGVAGFNHHFANLAGAIVVAVAVTLKSVIEEPLLAQRFPDYPEYRNRTKRFIPFLL